MFPLRDDNPTLHASIATVALVAINAFVWIFVQGLGSDPQLTASVWRFGLIPGELLGLIPGGTSVPIGKHAMAILDGVPNWWSVITSMFMHGGWMHIIGKMWFLLVFGDNVEDAMGPVRFTIFYLLCGVAAAAAQTISGPGSVMPMVGASGAIGGVMGAYLRLYPTAPVHMLVFLGFYVTRVAVPAFFMLGYWFLLQIVSGAVDRGTGGVAFWAHVGGFLAGLLLVGPLCNSARLAAHRAHLGRIGGRVQWD
ncbi:MAG TPA: rhomboid family intramembrane serine protease [Verrucomicrobiae bacterium]|nr:rhomboid family intramembrane serine protease [Verrucomicrobiae bacterium]